MIDVILITLLELVRRRFVLAAIVATAVLVLLTAWGFHSLVHAHDRHGVALSPLEVRTTSAGLVLLIAYMFSFVLAVAATFVAAPALANEIESGVLLPIAARPIARTTILIGKIVGIGLMLGGYLFVTGLVELTIVRAITGYAPPHPFAAFGFIWLLALVMIALATLLGTRLSAIASSIVAVMFFGVAWIGGIVGGIGGAVRNEALVNAGTISQLVLPSDAMWQAAAYRLEPAAMVIGMQQAAAHNSYGGPFLIAAPPPLPTVLWTLAWIVVVVSLASWSFARRSL